MNEEHPKFVVIGGGTGSFTLLSGLKHYVRDLTALVNMADDGGSTGVLRDELGVLPPGDIRQCLVALSGSPHLRDLFNYRFPDGGALSGHSFGNLFLSAVQKMTNSFDGAISLASEVLKLEGRVLPITLEECVLVLERGSFKDVVGEDAIGRADVSEPRPVIRLQTPARILDKARDAIMDSNLTIIAPGDLYTSLAPALIVEGVGEALAASKGKVVYIANLINKPNQTRGYCVHDYVSELERLAGTTFIDYVLYNTDEPGKELLGKYAADGEYPVGIDLGALERAGYKSIGGSFLARSHAAQDPNDSLLSRSLIRHDTTSVARSLMRLYYS